MRLERERLGLTQTGFGEQCGVRKQAQINYEKGERIPDATYLMHARRLGVDVTYLLEGSPGGSLTNEEQRLLALYRLAESGVKQAVLAALAVGTTATISSSASTATFLGPVGQRIEGGMHGGTATINMGGGRSKKK